jgi:DNA repair exonuclease SbcCD ATPase subunit
VNQQINQERIERRANLEHERDRHLHNIEDLERKGARTPDILFGEKCNPCPLYEDWAAIPSLIKVGEGERDRLNDAIANLPDLLPLQPETTYTEQITDARLAQNRIEAAKSHAGTAERLLDEIAQAQGQLMEHEEQEYQAKVEDPYDLLKQVQKDIDRYADAPAKVQALENAKLDFVTLQSRLEAMTNKMDEAHKALQETQEAALEAKRTETETTRQINDTKEAIWAGEAELTGLREAKEQLARKIVENESRLQAQREKVVERDKLRAALAVDQDNYDGLADLMRCYGVRGVRQILVDEMAPGLEEIADELFNIATEGKQRIRISTSRIGEAGQKIEDFSIMVRHKRGERDVSRFSGGQLQLILILFRVAVSIYVGRLRNQPPDCLILDEALDRLGDIGTEPLMNVVNYLHEKYDMSMILITHDHLIAAQMPSRIEVEEGPMTSAIHCYGVAA